MIRDPIIEEVRQIRRKIESDCEDDPKRFYEHVQELQEKYRDRLVQRKPKPDLRRKKLAV